MANERDIGHEEVDALISDLEDELNREYTQAANEMREKANTYLDFFKAEDIIKRKQLADGKITLQEYRNWRISHLLTGQRWVKFADVLAKDLTNTNKIAYSIIYGYMPSAYATGINYATYNVEKVGIDTSFTLYSRQTVERLIRDKPDLLPKPKVEIPKDLRWNKQQLNSAVTQGILQGESIPEIANRLANVSTMNEHSAVRNARTMITNAENGGRNDGYIRADKMGVELTVEWSATLDHRTRLSHRLLHGQRRAVNEYFYIDGIKIKYPADLGGKSYKVPPSEIYNCRCTMLARIKGFEGDTVKNSPKLRGVSYTAWKNAKKDDAYYKSEMNIKSDYSQYNEYKKLKIQGLPSTFEDFQQLKYTQKSAWATMKQQARQKRKVRK